MTATTNQVSGVELNINPGAASLYFARGTTSAGTHTYTKGNNKATLQVIKGESEQLSYKVAMFCVGLGSSDGPRWICQINDQFPLLGTGNLAYQGSKKLVFTPVDADTLEIQETREKEEQKLWLDLSDQRAYRVYKQLPLVSKKVEDLIAKGSIFKTADGANSEAILYSRHAGAFLRIGEELYHARDSEEFVKCALQETPRSSDDFVCVAKTSEGTYEEVQDRHSEWTVTLPKENKSHILDITKDSNESDETYIRFASVDKSPLKVITLRK